MRKITAVYHDRVDVEVLVHLVTIWRIERERARLEGTLSGVGISQLKHKSPTAQQITIRKQNRTSNDSSIIYTTMGSEKKARLISLRH